MTRIFSIILISIFFLGSLFSESLSFYTDLPQEDFPLQNNLLRQGDEPLLLKLLPEVEGAADVRSRFSSFNPEVTIEKLYRLPLPAHLKTANNDNVKEILTILYNSFGNPESQMGYTYHSATRDKDIELFEECYISDEKGRRRNNFSFDSSNLPTNFSYYQYVDEANFSGTVLEQTVNITGNTFNNHSVNRKTIWFMVFPVMDKGSLRSETIVFPYEDYLFVYTNSQVEKEPGVKKIGVPLHLPSMFGKRMDVLVQWLSDQFKIASE